MDGYWLPVSAAAVVGACALLLLVALVVRARRRVTAPRSPVDVAGAGPVGANGVDEAVSRAGAGGGMPAAGRPQRVEWPSAVTSCELSLSRARRAVDAVSSQEARNCLHVVLRRMDAELPNVRVLAELGTSLQQTADGPAVQRVRAQLQDAVHRYALFAEELLGEVEELVHEADLDRTRQHVESLRRRFPLLRPMSELVDGPRPPALAPG